MQIIRGLYNLSKFNSSLISGCVLTIGNFDGIHLGHKKILKCLKDKSKLLNIPSMVMIFEPSPAEYFSGDNAPARLMNLREKLEHFKDLSVDFVLVCKFNCYFSKITPTKFVSEILVSKINAKYILIGDDFRFGIKREGDFHLLKSLEMEYNFCVNSMPSFNFLNERVSSTCIRQALLESPPNLPKTKFFMGRDFSFYGRVVHGRKLGRKIGFSTLNLNPKRINMPISGVFAVRVYGLDNKMCYGVANIGIRPTVSGLKPSIEVHLLDWDKLVYGVHVKVVLHEFIRKEIKFDSLEALINQIKNDVIKAKYYFNLINKQIK